MLFCITKVKFNLESRTIIVNVIFPVKFKIGAKQIAGAKKIKDTIGIAENIRAEFLGILRRAFYKSSLFRQRCRAQHLVPLLYSVGEDYTLTG